MAKDKNYYLQLLSNTNVVAYLNAISQIEAPTYYTANGGYVHVPTSAAHPNTIFQGGTSAAFGRYQFMPSTWEEIQQGLGPLDIRNPRDQDIAALYRMDTLRGTLNDVIAGNCLATLDSNSLEWAAMPNSSSGFRYKNQGSKYTAESFCKLVDSLKGVPLPEGPAVSLSALSGLGQGLRTAPATALDLDLALQADITCAAISAVDLYRANYQITNPGCKISNIVRPVTGSSTNGAGVANSILVAKGAKFAMLAQGFAMCSSLRLPTQGTFTSGFGWRNERMHNGVDIANNVGTPIFASSNGVVNEAGWNDGGYGNRVVITSPEGILTTYNHLEAIFCSVGQQVVVGQRIGDMGNTGYSTGPHLHFEIKINGDFIDPEQCLRFR